jgi:D-alanine-D-alanine ligase
MIQVALLMGGNSTEHEISLLSSQFIYNTLDRTKYKVKPILIDKTNHWFVPEEYEIDLPNTKDIFANHSSQEIHKVYKDEFLKNKISNQNILDSLQDIQICFLGLHGGDGESGRLQAFLEYLQIPYTGSDVLSSALAMNKAMANVIFRENGLNVANYLNLHKEDFPNFENLINSLNFPLFIKPNTGGSSVGAYKVKNKEELKDKLEFVFKTETEILIQECIIGTEVSCGVLEFNREGKRELVQLYPTEIVPKQEFFNYESKYFSNLTEEITPARLEVQITEKIRNSSALAHKILGCYGYSRTDFIVQNGIPFILETNTLPGMTETSLIPAQAKFSNIKMVDVFDSLINLGFERFNSRLF